MYTGDMFASDENYQLLLDNNFVPNMEKIKEQWSIKVNEVLKIQL